MIVLLLDGHNLLYRSFVTLPNSIVDDEGRAIHGVYGLLGAVIRIVRDVSPDKVVATFDEPDIPTFRHELYPSYQGQRGPLGGEHADEFNRQTGVARDVLPKIGIPALSMPGFEADDVMATLATSTESQGDRSVVVSTDRDLLQLVSDCVEVYVPGSNGVRVRDANAVRERIGVPPGGVTTFKALAGDASDNIPGVVGIGAKTARDLVLRFGDLETIYASPDAHSTRVARALVSGRDKAFLFRRLVTLVTDLQLPVSVDALPDTRLTAHSKARALLREVGV